MIYNLLPFVFAAFLTMPAKNNIIGVTPSVETRVISNSTTNASESSAESLYHSLDMNNLSRPAQSVFAKALEGFYRLKAKGVITKDILTVVDFSLSANQKRMWVIDLSQKKILFNTLVAHGRNTGNEFAETFSNRPESNQSSLGFYATGEIYHGKHGMSLKLDGLERGKNDNARNRAVVVHGADYVSEKFIKQNSRLGRSQGCPAIPVELTKEIITTIKDKSCLFIFHPKDNKPLEGIS